jgi:3-hydroxyacyl-CoA dehydrogenase
LSTPVEFRRDGNVGVILIDNPPVNALRHDVRVGIMDGLKAARDDDAVKALVIACKGRTFIAGADITEFGKPPKAPSLLDLIAALDEMPKPTIAALHGTPLGGGFELALGCHFRVAAPGTRPGLPEIKLGLLPGAGGTVRLPRLIGAEKALQVILSGDPMPMKAAVADGIIDEIIEGDLLVGTTAFARRVVEEKRPLKRLRDRDEKLAAARANPQVLSELITPAIRRARGTRAPMACLDAVKNALSMPFDQALKRERELFVELLMGEESKAQRHLFFAEREAAKVPDLPDSVKPREIKRAAVIGAGTMGGGISMCFANAGIPVTIVENSADALKAGLGKIEKNYRATAARGGLTPEDVDKRMALIKGVVDIEATADADMVIEAVFEEMPIKKEVFSKLDRIVKKGAVLASNTSYLDINAIGATTSRPGDVLGTHFFSPANVMKLLEIVRGDKTSPEVLATALAVSRKLGKVPVVVGVCDGFVGNRMLRARSIEAERMLIEGALPQEMDAAIVEFGFPMGQFAMGDLAGLDIGWRKRKAGGQRAEVIDALCEMGRFGQKTGKGFYRYEGGARTPIPDPEVEALIVATSKRLGVTRRHIDKKEIVERMIFPMINEGARLLEEGIARRPGDIDVVWVYGYAWPVWRGGPMFYADTVGLPYIRDQLAKFAVHSKDKNLEPAALLKKLAAEGRGFASLTEKAA